MEEKLEWIKQAIINSGNVQNQNNINFTNRLVKSIKSLTDGLTDASKSSEKLSSRVFWLNVILAILTFLGVVFTAISAIPVIQSLF